MLQVTMLRVQLQKGNLVRKFGHVTSQPVDSLAKNKSLYCVVAKQYV